VCRKLRQKGIDTPIIILTVKNAELDRVSGLELGADDYITKPFSLRELEARIRVQLRRRARDKRAAPERYVLGQIEIDFARQSARRGNTPIKLTPKSLELLRFLVQHPNEVLTRERVLHEVWGYDPSVNTRTVDTHIVKLRQKLEADPARPEHIRSVYGGGYKFIE
jgi:two-component system alkaline phosphatase synthesis response regulator PhoP